MNNWNMIYNVQHVQEIKEQISENLSISNS